MLILAIKNQYKKLGLRTIIYCSLSFVSILLSPNAVNSQFDPNIQEIGIESEGQTTLNLIVIPYYEYYGECPGSETGAIRGWFTSSQYPPASDRRVVVRNVSRGMSPEDPPYTDREYLKGRSSEGFDMRFGKSHDQRFFRVLPNVNIFEYEINEGSTVIDRGLFKSEVRPSSPIRIERNREKRTKSVPIEYQEYNQNRQRYETKTRYESQVVYECPN
jgi:hypothetical protein